jgi:hypothetical protein
MDVERLEVRALGALAAAGGPEVRKREWNRLVGLGVPIGPTLTEAVEVLEGEGLAERRNGLVVVGSVDGATLADVVGPFLRDEAGSCTQQRNLRKALGQLYGLNQPVRRQQAIEAARQTPLAEAYLLPARIREQALRRAFSDMGLRQRMSAARTAVEHAIFRHRISGFAVPHAWIMEVPRDEETEAILKALAELWVRGETPTQERVCEIAGVNAGTYYRRVTALAEIGRATMAERKRGHGLVAVSPRGIKPAGATLATVVRGADADQPSIRRGLKALRSYLDVPVSGRLDLDRIANAAEEIPYDRLRHLPDLVRDHHLARGAAASTAASSRSTVRRLLLEAAAEGRIPMVWTSAWEEARDTWIPRTKGTVDGAGYQTRMRYRWSLGHVREAAMDLWGEEMSPYDLTVERMENIRRWLRRRGRWDHAALVLAPLQYAGRRGYGPFAGHEDDPGGGSPLLPGIGDASVKTLEGMTATLRGHGLDEEWLELVRDLTDWSTLPAREVRMREGLPSRPRARKVKSMRNRYDAIRLVLGVLARGGHDLAKLSPSEAFGYRLVKQSLDRAVLIWEDRFRAGELSSPCGSGFRNVVPSVGLVSEYLYRLEQHRRGEELAQAPSNKRRWGLDPEAEEGAHRTPRGESFWRAYRYSREIGDELREEAEGITSGDNLNTEKDIAQILEAVPPQLLEDLVAAYHRLARRSLEEDGESDHHHRLILHAFLTCLLVSTGARGQGLAHIRCDVHLPEEFFDPGYDGPIAIELRAADRKNSKAHKVLIRPEIIPTWLRTAFLQTREALMRRAGLRRPGTGKPVSGVTSREAREWPAKERYGLGRDEEGVRDSAHLAILWHQHLLVGMDGKPVGDPGEDRRGQGRESPQALERRVNLLRHAWKNHAGRILWSETSWDCPVEDGRWTFHVIRGVVGYALYQISLTDAENYLGDSPQAIRSAYAGVAGHHISSTAFARALAWRGGEVER